MIEEVSDEHAYKVIWMRAWKEKWKAAEERHVVTEMLYAKAYEKRISCLDYFETFR